MKKILIAGGSHADIPIILAAKKQGYFVITGGNKKDDYGHKYSDSYEPFDYSDKEEVLNITRKCKVDAICASANDFSALSCSYVAQELDLPGHDDYQTAQTVHHKDKFREYAQKLNLSVPKAYKLNHNESFENILANLDFPLIVKPIDLSGGKGMTRVDTAQMLSDAINHAFEATRQNTVVIEEFIEGSNHGYSTLVQNQKIIFAFMDDEHYFVNPYLVSGASTSLHYDQKVADKLNEDLEKLAKSLKLADGLLHVQFILRDNTPYIIEICRRTPGDLYVKLVEYACAYPMAEAIVRSVTDKPLPTLAEQKQIKYITRHCVMSPKEEKIDHIDYGLFESMIFDKFTMFKYGDYIKSPQTYKAEIDFIQYKDKEEMKRLRAQLTDEIQIRLKV